MFYDVYEEDLVCQVVVSDYEVLEVNVSIIEEFWLCFVDGCCCYFEMCKVLFFD